METKESLFEIEAPDMLEIDKSFITHLIMV